MLCVDSKSLEKYLHWRDFYKSICPDNFKELHYFELLSSRQVTKSHKINTSCKTEKNTSASVFK